MEDVEERSIGSVMWKDREVEEEVEAVAEAASNNGACSEPPAACLASRLLFKQHNQI